MSKQGKQRTITLTGRPPVVIHEDAWPSIAQASTEQHDGQVRSQANRKSSWSVRVRQHEDGRAVVYATYFYESAYQGERSISARAGFTLPAGVDDLTICDTIKKVCRHIADLEHHGDDAARWVALEADCIANMPAEELL